jgi:type IV pilus assembly protein PilM
MLQLAPGSGGLKIGAAAQRAMPPELPTEGPQRRELLIDTCRSALRQAKFRGRQAVVSLSHPAIRYKNIRLPKMSGPELEQAVRWEASERFGEDAGALSVQHINVGELPEGSGDEARQEVILIGIPQAVVDEHTEILRACGLHPAILEVTPTALASYFSRISRRRSDQSTVRAVVDLGAGGTRVLILRGCDVMFYRPLQMEDEPVGAASVGVAQGERATQTEWTSGGSGLAAPEPDEAAGPNTSTAAIEDLAGQIDMCLRYYSVTFRGEPPEAVYLSGGRAVSPDLRPVLSERLGLEVRPVPALHEVELSASNMIDREEALPRWAVAAGLALRDVAATEGAGGGHA